MRRQWSGEEARELRVRSGYSQASLSWLLGVHRATLARWEAGGPVPRRVKPWLDALADAVEQAERRGWSLPEYAEDSGVAFAWHRLLSLAWDERFGDPVERHLDWLAVQD